MIFDVLVNNVLPLYGLICIGFIVGKFTDLDVTSIATIMLYAVLPFVMFGATATMEFSMEYMLPPLIIASISIVASGVAYIGSLAFWHIDDKRRNLLALLSVSPNATYFGVPIALALGGEKSLGVYMMMVLPLFILDCTLAYYYGARGKFNARKSFTTVMKLPIIYAAIAGVGFNSLGFELSELLLEYWNRFTGAIIILGMIMIGAALSTMKQLRFDWSFFCSVIILRYFIWPILGVFWVLLDRYVFHMLSSNIHTFILLICACPFGANAVAYTVKLDLHPALTACMVVITTLIALPFIPFLLQFR